MSTSWSPLLRGSLRTQALEAMEAVARQVSSDSKKRRLPHGLMQGHAGYALFFDMASRALGERYLEDMSHHLQEAVQVFMRQRAPRPGLHAGLAGLAWAAAHLARRYRDIDAEELLTPADGMLEEALRQRPWPHPCDIRDGLAGIGIYALERLPHPNGRKLLEQVVQVLEETAERSEAGVTWPMPRSYWSLHGPQAQFPHGLYTVGLAHGVPGALALLAAAHAQGVEPERAQALLEGGFRWLERLAAPEAHPRFPHYLHGAERFEDERFSWCVGNPGITAVLWWAAHRWGHAGWQARTLGWATEVAREALQRRPSTNHSNLCCGTAGTALLFLRLFHTTGQPAFEEAAVRWVEHTLALRQPGAGAGGFGATEDPARVAMDLQFGAAGTALALLAAASELEPGWDRAFLFSLR